MPISIVFLVVFLVIQTCGKIWCDAMENELVCSTYMYLEGEEGEGEIPTGVVRRRCDPAAMPPPPPTYDGINYDNKGGRQCDEWGGADNDDK